MNATVSRQPVLSFAGMDAVEIKVTIRPDQEWRAERSMATNEDTPPVLHAPDLPRSSCHCGSLNR